MDERLQFVARRLAGEPMAELCREFGISRKTGYKIFDRYQECGVQGLTDRRIRPRIGTASSSESGPASRSGSDSGSVQESTWQTPDRSGSVRENPDDYSSISPATGAWPALSSSRRFGSISSAFSQPPGLTK